MAKVLARERARPPARCCIFTQEDERLTIVYGPKSRTVLFLEKRFIKSKTSLSLSLSLSLFSVGVEGGGGDSGFSQLFRGFTFVLTSVRMPGNEWTMDIYAISYFLIKEMESKWKFVPLSKYFTINSATNKENMKYSFKSDVGIFQWFFKSIGLLLNR